MLNPDGHPLPPKPGAEQFPTDPRNRSRVLAPQRSQFGAPDIFGGQKEAENATREREAKAEQYRSFFFRKHGRQPSEAEVREHLGETAR